MAAGEVSHWDTLLRFVYQVPYGQSDPLYEKDIGFYLSPFPPMSPSKWLLLMPRLERSSSLERCIGERWHRPR